MALKPLKLFQRGVRADIGLKPGVNERAAAGGGGCEARSAQVARPLTPALSPDGGEGEEAAVRSLC